MVGIKETAILSLILLLMILSFTSGEDSGQDLYERSYNDVFPLDRKLQYLLETKRSINGIKNLIEELQDRLEYQGIDSGKQKGDGAAWDSGLCHQPKKRTACALDGGMSASCNHKDAVEAGAHHRFLASSFAPGRRKRRSAFQPFLKNLNFSE